MESDRKVLGSYKIIFETKHFNVVTLDSPHIDRDDGGHIIIALKKNGCKNRTELPIDVSLEMMLLTMIVGEAMSTALNKSGIDIGCINYQENGNWAFLREIEPSLHIHIYGRAKSAKHQKFGQALFFPDPNGGFFEGFKPLGEDDIAAIRQEIQIVEKNEKYKDYIYLLAGGNGGNTTYKA